jgi:hypothetical protein
VKAAGGAMIALLAPTMLRGTSVPSVRAHRQHLPLGVHGKDIIPEAVRGDDEHRVPGEGVTAHRLERKTPQREIGSPS